VEGVSQMLTNIYFKNANEGGTHNIEKFYGSNSMYDELFQSC
jgi:hypothetical protein